MTQLRVALWARQSKDSELGITRQLDRGRSMAKARGWKVVAQFQDNDVSASKPRGQGTDWWRMLHEPRNWDVLVAVDLDRLLRSTKDLNTLIDAGIKVVTVDGEIDLSTADGEFRATMLAGIARFEVRRKAERQKRANEQRARLGNPTTHSRAYGYRDDPAEAEVVRRIFRWFEQGMTMSRIATSLNDEGVATSLRAPFWRASAIRKILTNPRYCGRVVYQGKVLEGVVGNWTPLVEASTFDWVQTILEDPARRTAFSTDRKYLGSGLYLCGVCGEAMRPVKTNNSKYWCGIKGHLTRRSPKVDEFVTRAIKARLAGTQSLSRPTEDIKPIEREIAARQARIRSLAKMVADGMLDASDFESAVVDSRKQIAELEARVAAAHQPAIVSTDWDALDLDGQRRVIDLLCTVILHPVRNRAAAARSFDPESVQILWK